MPITITTAGILESLTLDHGFWREQLFGLEFEFGSHCDQTNSRFQQVGVRFGCPFDLDSNMGCKVEIVPPTYDNLQIKNVGHWANP